MTPLAQQIANDFARPARQREFKDQCDLQRRILDAHCFDVSEVFDAAADMTEGLYARGKTARGVSTFLPAPKTWLEWRYSNGAREGVLFEAAKGDKAATARWAFGHNGGELFLSAQFVGELMLDGDGAIDQSYSIVRALENDWKDSSRENISGWICHMYTLLAMINTPRVIGRRTHTPHVGLQRKLAAARGSVGKYPLHAWHEVVLEVSPPRMHEGEPIESHLTGRKAQHFCRAHLRIRCGSLELVSAHWRGDPALGMKQTRYRLTTPAQGKASHSPSPP